MKDSQLRGQQNNIRVLYISFVPHLIHSPQSSHWKGIGLHGNEKSPLLAGNCHAYACSSLCLSVRPHVSASHCLAVRLSGCPQRFSNSGVILGCPCMVGLSPTAYGCCWAYPALEAAVGCNRGCGRKCAFLTY